MRYGRIPSVVIRIMGLTVFLMSAFPADAAQLSSVSRFGITWTFDGTYECGHFANGDWWVRGPVTITSISPPSFMGDGVMTMETGTDNEWVPDSGRIVNGSMLNPMAPEKRHGYDNAISSFDYAESLNVARRGNAPVSAGNPLELGAHSSLISTISLDHNHSLYRTGQGYVLKSAAILTVLDTIPPDGSFRPGHCGTDKNVKFNESELNYSLLRELDPQDFCTADDVVMTHWTDDQASSAERMVHRPWIDHLGGGMGDVNSPLENMLSYPGYRNRQMQEIALYLNLDWSGVPGFTSNRAFKRNLLVGTVQIGIDNYSNYLSGVTDEWEANGGHGVSRKWPILFAGAMLGSDSAHADAAAMAGMGFNPSDSPYFSEDEQTRYVDQDNIDVYAATYGSGATVRTWADSGTSPYVSGVPGTGEEGVCGAQGYTHPQVSSCLNGCGPDSRDKFDIPYTEADADNRLPAFAIWGTPYLYRSNRAWNTMYRRGQTGSGWVGIALSLLIMDMKEAWNHDAFFDYTDRFVAVEKGIRAAMADTFASLSAVNDSLSFIDYPGTGYIYNRYTNSLVSVPYEITGTPAADWHGNPVNETFDRYYVAISDFVANMWDAYRADYGTVWSDTAQTGAVVPALSLPVRTGSGIPAVRYRLDGSRVHARSAGTGIYLVPGPGGIAKIFIAE